MTLFEINHELEELLSQLVDEETGEINEDVYAKVEALEMNRDEKIDSWCYYLKQRKAELDAAKDMLNKAQLRYRAMEDSLDRTKQRLRELMNGEKFKSAFNTIYYTKSDVVMPDQDANIYDIDDDFLVYAKPTLNKTKIKAALKLGIEIPGVHLEKHTSMVIR